MASSPGNLDIWPPVYDENWLAETILEMVRDLNPADFFASRAEPPVCQGDVFRLKSMVPQISAEGKPIAEGETEYWLVIGNTCDFDRTYDDVPFTQVVPIEDCGDSVRPEYITSLRRYEAARAFYLPPWNPDFSSKVLIADFLQPVTLDKKALQAVATFEAGMTQRAWALLHACLIRFLCRGDRRFS